MTDAVDVVTGELVHLPAGRLTPAETAARTTWLHDVTRAALVEHVDYGIIPGTDRPSLLKPGAEMLLLAAGLGFTNQRVDDDDARNRRGVTYKCTVHDRDGFVHAECDGYAGYDESRYYVSAEDAERRERLRADKDRRPVRKDRIVEYRAPWNTLIKMAQKRALVGAALNAVAGSGLFVAPDDVDDETPATTAPNRPTAARRPPTPPVRAADPGEPF